MNNSELTRPVGPVVFRQPEGLLKTDAGTPSQALYRQNMIARDLQRNIPETSAIGRRIRAVENPTVHANLALHQMTPEAVRGGRDLRQTVTQTVGGVNKRMAWAGQENPAIARNQLAPTGTTRHVTTGRYGYGELTQDDRLVSLNTSRIPKRNNDNLGIFDSRNAQDARLFQSSGKNMLKDVLEKRYPPRTAFVTQSTDRTAASIDARSNKLFSRNIFNPLKTDDPRFARAPLGTAVVRKASGYASRPIDTRSQ